MYLCNYYIIININYLLNILVIMIKKEVATGGSSTQVTGGSSTQVAGGSLTQVAGGSFTQIADCSSTQVCVYCRLLCIIILTSNYY